MSGEYQMNIVNKIAQYPLINDTISIVPQWYQWFKSSNRLFDAVLSKTETILSLIKETTEPFAGPKLKSIDEILCDKLDRCEKILPPVIEKPKELLYESYKIYMINCRGVVSMVLRPIKFVSSPISSLKNKIVHTKTKIDDFICNCIGFVFDKFIPEVDDTESVNSILTYEKRFPSSHSFPGSYYCISKMAYLEMNNFHQSNTQFLEKMQCLISQIKAETDESLVNELLYHIQQHCDQVAQFTSNFRLLSIDKMTYEIVSCLEFFNENVFRLQDIIRDERSKSINDKFLFRINSLLDQLQEGLDLFLCHLKQCGDDLPEWGDSVNEITSELDFTPDSELFSENPLNQWEYD